jgi:hypothetical protein
MREEKDRSGKWMVTHHGDSLLRLAGMKNLRAWRPGPAEVLTPLQAPDGFLEVFLDNDPQPSPVLIEIATYPEHRAADQSLFDALSVLLARRQVPDVLTVVLHPKGQIRLAGSHQRASRQAWTSVAVAWRVLELWTLAAEELLAANDVGLIPWVPLTTFAGPPEELLRQCRERIDQQAKPEERANLLAVSQVLARLRYTDPGLLAFFGGSQIMIESPLIQELMATRMHKAILGLLAKRFGKLPADLEKSLRAIQDEDRLDQLVCWAAECPDVAAFAKQLTP